MKIKKILITALALGILAGCGKDTEEKTDQNPPLAEESLDIDEKREEKDLEKEKEEEKKKKEEEEKAAKEKKELEEELKKRDEAEKKALEERLKAEEAEREKIAQEKEKQKEEQRQKDLENKLAQAYQAVRVTRVVDGDTIEVNDGKETYKLRLIGVNTPETVHPNKDVEFFGKEASAYTKSVLEGRNIYIEKDVSDRDRYQRLLRYVWLERPSSLRPSADEIGTKTFNARLVKDGYAYSSAYAPDVKYQDIFANLQKQAERTKAGLWNPKAREDFENSKTPKERPQEYPEKNKEETPADKAQENKDPSTEKPSEDPQENSTKEESLTRNPDGTVIGITSTAEVTIGKRTFTADTTPHVIKGNSSSMIYHSPGQRDYNKISVNNVVHFATREEAEKAGYRPAQR